MKSKKYQKLTMPLDVETASFKLKINQKHQLTAKQKTILKTMMDAPTKCVFVDGLWGTSKAQPLDAKVLTPSGWRLMGELQVGDEVMSADGKPTKVLGVYPQGEKEIFKVVFSDGAQTECCGDHLWLTQTERERNKHKRARNAGDPVYTKTPSNPKVRALSEIRETLLVSKDHLNHSIPIVADVQFSEKGHVIHPYILGVLLGDGCLKRGTKFTCFDTEIAERVKTLLPLNLELRNSEKHPNAFLIARADKKQGMHGLNPFTEELKKLKLMEAYSYEKFVPEEYLIDSIENRLELLRGLMDTDGCAAAKCSTFATTSPHLAKNVQFLVQSLGGTAVMKNRFPTFTYKGVKKNGREAYVVSVKLPNKHNPFFLPRKRDIVHQRTKYFPIRYFTAVEPVGKKEVQCILVENESHLYVTDDMIVTHNTYLSVLSALQMYNTGKYDQIIYVRNPIESSSTGQVGLLPGGQEEKMQPYNAIFFDKLEEFLSANDVDDLKKDNAVACLPLSFCRGRSWTNKLVIVDEAASMTFDDLLLILSRCGENTKIIVIGDTTCQNDIGKKSGYKKMFDKFNDEESKKNGVFTFEMKDADDIVRSGFLRFVMEKLEILKVPVK